MNRYDDPMPEPDPLDELDDDMQPWSLDEVGVLAEAGGSKSFTAAGHAFD